MKEKKDSERKKQANKKYGKMIDGKEGSWIGF